MAKSLREMRRQKARKDAHYLRMMEASPIEQKQAALFRNGITHEDMKRETKKAFDAGRHVTEQFLFHVIYAATLITLCDKHGWDSNDAVKLLKEIDHQVALCVDDVDMADEAYEKTGVEFKWSDPLERIQEREE